MCHREVHFRSTGETGRAHIRAETLVRLGNGTWDVFLIYVACENVFKILPFCHLLAEFVIIINMHSVVDLLIALFPCYLNICLAPYFSVVL